MEPVMTLASDLSPYGAFDMAANAWEWTSEYYDSRYYKQFRNLVIDPTGPKESPARIALVTVKGGSKSGHPDLAKRSEDRDQGYLTSASEGPCPCEGAPIAPVAAPAECRPGPQGRGPAVLSSAVPDPRSNS